MVDLSLNEQLIEHNTQHIHDITIILAACVSHQFLWLNIGLLRHLDTCMRSRFTLSWYPSRKVGRKLFDISHLTSAVELSIIPLVLLMWHIGDNEAPVQQSIKRLRLSHMVAPHA